MLVIGKIRKKDNNFIKNSRKTLLKIHRITLEMKSKPLPSTIEAITFMEAQAIAIITGMDTRAMVTIGMMTLTQIE